jgi:hypothetical protein
MDRDETYPAPSATLHPGLVERPDNPQIQAEESSLEPPHKSPSISSRLQPTQGDENQATWQ